jgi:hypothetical protein
MESQLRAELSYTRREHKTEDIWYHRLLMCQSADGYFELTKEIALILGEDLDDLQMLAKKIEGMDSKVNPDHVLATCLAILLLRKRARKYHEQWRKAELKARTWIEDNARAAEINEVPLMDRLKEIFANKL